MPLAPAKITPPKTALVNARLIDPETGRDEAGGLIMDAGGIVDMGPHLLQGAREDVELIDCGGHVVMPGLIDMQVSVGEPGAEHRETLKTAGRAAIAGGVTSMVTMANVGENLDDVALIEFLRQRAVNARVKVLPMAALTKGLAGKEMAEIGLLKAAGAVAFSNGGRSVRSASLMNRLLRYAKDFDGLVVHHVEDPDLASEGVMNAGEMAARLGLKGVPTVAETIMLERDLRLVEIVGGRYHAAQLTCAQSLDVMRSAKARGLPVTAGISVNHLTLNETDVGPYRSFFKMRPPLRSEDDRMACVEALTDGTINVIVSAHDPQDADVKRRPFADAADGAVGLDTLLPAALRLYHSGVCDLMTVLRAMTSNPASLLNRPEGRLAIGAPADVILVDLDVPWVLNPTQLKSRSQNTPFEGAKLQGRVLRTFVAGRQLDS